MVLPAGFEIAAITEREDPRDAFVSDNAGISTLPAGAASAPRACAAKARCARAFRDSWSGRAATQTRLKKLDAGIMAIILAAAGLQAVGLAGHATSSWMKPAGAGAGRSASSASPTNSDVITCTSLDHARPPCVRAERALSRALSGKPAAARCLRAARWRAATAARFVASQDGSWCARADGADGRRPRHRTCRATQGARRGADPRCAGKTVKPPMDADKRR